MAKIEPAVTQLLYPVSDGTSYIDLAKDLSKVNRRLYRQGMTYVIQDIQCIVPAGLRPSDVATFTFSTMGNSWIVHNAWVKAYKLWRSQQNAVRRALGSHTEAKWADFKIHLDDSMRSGTTLEPYAGDSAVYLAGEWLYSQYVWDDAGTERESYAHMIGSNTGTTDFGLIQNYADSRPRTLSSVNPILEADASATMYAKMLNLGIDDELAEDLVDNFEDHNDTPPYDNDDYPGGDTNADAAVPVRLGAVSGTQATMTVPGFVAPCGLIKVFTSELALTDAHAVTLADDSTSDGPGPNSVYQQGTASQSYLIVTVAPGPYRGVLAAPMGQ